MMKQLSFIVFLACGISAFAQHPVRFIIHSMPQSKDSNYYIAGSFNSWNPGNEVHRFQKDASGIYFLELKLNDGMHEFKITRGGWDKVECRKNGAGVTNRFFKLTNDTTIEIRIEDWADHYQAKPKKSTAGKNVHIIDTAFQIPQLNRTRRIWVYLPPGYETSKKKYPVLYMHDGQNVFDDLTSYVGEWGVDEFMDSLKESNACIVVGVDHGGGKRINEYCPYDFNTRVGGGGVQGKGEGDQYVDFLVQTLKPYIDKNYKTKKAREHTYVAGSSMGGIISMYAVLKYPDVFGGAGVFSPAFWVGPKIFDDIKEKGDKVKAKIYFYAGGKESERMVPDMEKAYEEIKKVSKHPKNFIPVVDVEAMHNEVAWRKYFPRFYLWLIGE
jgi:predicted alpha/beta superfamily hydrolase